MRAAIVLLGSTLALLLSSVAYADELKVGVVDLSEILREAAQVKEIGQRLEKQFSDRQEELLEIQGKLQENMAKLERDAAILSDDEVRNLEGTIVAQQRELQEKGQGYQQDLGTAQNEEMQQFFDEVQQAVQELAQQEDYTLVVQEEVVLYVKDELDITKQVLEQLKK